MTQPPNSSGGGALPQRATGKGPSNPLIPGSIGIYREAHRSADTDEDRSAIHHTLGGSPNQAAPGNHSHDLSDYVVKPPNVANSWNLNPTSDVSGLALAGVTAIHTNYIEVGALVFIWFSLWLSGTPTAGGHSVAVDAPSTPWSPLNMNIGSGREDQVTGVQLELGTRPGLGANKLLILSYNSTLTGTTVQNNWRLTCNGFYMKAP